MKSRELSVHLAQKKKTKQKAKQSNKKIRMGRVHSNI
jgi:hypothetical protein